MDFGTAFSYAFQDEEWIKKILIGAVLVLTGIGMIPVLGWMMEIIRRSKDGDYSLPEWADFGTLFMDGLKAMAIGLIWSIPAAVIGGCIAGGSVLVGDTSNDVTYILGWVLVALSSCLALPYSLGMLLLAAPMIGILADTGEFGMALNPANSFKLFRNNIGGYLITLVVQMFGFPILSSIGSIACGVGAFAAMAYGYSILGNLYGQAYAAAKTA
jgi:hypothetical protein